MALTNSRDFITTRNDIIESALRKVKAIPQNGLPTTSQYSNCSKALNAIVKFLHVEDGVFLWESSLSLMRLTPQRPETHRITKQI